MADSLVGTDTNSVDFGNLGSAQKIGTLRQVSLHTWKEDSVKDGRDRFELTETNRDQWSVYLFDNSRKVALQVDLFTKTIFYSDPKAPRRAQYSIVSSSSRPTGWLANRVEVGSAPGRSQEAFKQVGASDWTEDRADGSTAFKFSETGRDDGSVYLLDSSRNVRIQLDLYKSVVLYSSGSDPAQEINKVVSASTKLNGWLVNKVDYLSAGATIAASFRQTDVHTWVEETLADGKTHFEFHETNRDEWSVYLNDSSRNVSLQLDLFKGIILYSDAKTTPRQLYVITRTDMLPRLGMDNGKTVNLVEYIDSTGAVLGHFRQTSEETWSEDTLAKGRDSFLFDEIARDDWSVYLYDSDRDTWIQLDLFKKEVSFHSTGQQSQVLYSISSTGSAMNGWLVNAVEYYSSPSKLDLLVQVGWTRWIEYSDVDRSVANHFDETGRDDWSVYLHDPARNVKLQIDLFQKKILYAAGADPMKDLYDITDKFHRNEIWRLPHRVTSRSSLTEDYDVAPGKAPVPKPVYRTSISVPVQVTSVEIWASEEVTLEINSVSYTIDPVKTARVKPSSASRLSVSMPADDVGCPHLFLRTNLMKADQQHIVMPDVDVHKKIGDFKDGELYAAREQLGIAPSMKAEDVASVQKALKNITSTVQYAYNETFHGTHHDRALLPANMEDPHFKLDFSGHGANYSALTKDEVLAHTQNARRIDAGAAQGLFDDFWNDCKKAGSVIVHTADKVGNTVVDTTKRATNDLSRAVSSVGEDVIHGDLLQAPKDLFRGGENLGRDLVVGAKEAGGELVQGAHQVLVITLNFAEEAGREALQFVISETAPIWKAVSTFLDKVGILLGKFVGYLLDKFGWDDVLHTHDVLLSWLNNRFDQSAAALQEVKKKGDNFFNNLSKTLDLEINSALTKFGVGSISTQPSPPAAFSSAIEKLEWLFGKLSDHAQSSSMTGFAMVTGPAIAQPGQSEVTKFIGIIESKIGTDGGTVMTAMGDSFEHLKRMFSDGQSAPQDMLGALLELARAAAHIGIDILTSIMDAVLDMAINVIDSMKTAVNAELDIPFLSAFYEGLTNGRKLTSLSLSALAIATPVTILQHAIDGKKPFGNLAVAQTAAEITASIELKTTWGIVYGVSHIVQSITATVEDALTVNEYRKDNSGRNSADSDEDFSPGSIGAAFSDGFSDAKQGDEKAEFNKISVFQYINFAIEIVSQTAGAPLPPGSQLTMNGPESVKDVFEASDYFGFVAFWLESACFIIEGLILAYSTIGKYKSCMTDEEEEKIEDFKAVFNLLRGLANFSLMITIDAFDQKKHALLQDKTIASMISAPIVPDPAATLAALESYVTANHLSVPYAGAVSDAEDYYFALNGFYTWAKGYGGIPEKTFGNCMDAFPELGEIGTLKQLYEATDGISLIVTAACDAIGHSAEGITWIVRASGGRIY